MQRGFYFDQTRCTGCDACTIACKDWHEWDIGSEPANWRWVSEFESGAYPDPSVTYLCLSCLHCARPSCVDVCPTKAISKRENDGVVVVQKDLCLGKNQCSLCQTACPYDAPKFGLEDDAPMQMCDLCVDRWESGKPPVCVTACPTRALDAGDIDDLRSRYGNHTNAPGFAWSSATRPSIVVKGKGGS